MPKPMNHPQVDTGAKSACFSLHFTRALGMRKPDAVIIGGREETAVSLGQASLEARILSNIMGREDKDNAYDLTRRVIGVDSVDVDGRIIGEVKQYLLGAGYFRQEKKLMVFKKLVLDCERISGLKERFEDVENMLKDFKVRVGMMYQQLLKDVRGAIKSRKEVEAD